MTRKIYATCANSHDHNAYDGSYHYIAERETRYKLNQWPNQEEGSLYFFDNWFKPQLESSDVFAFTWTHGGIDQLYNKPFRETILSKYEKNIAPWRPTNLWDHQFLDDKIYYCDHHCAHAAAAFIDSGFEESDVLAIDGGGSKFRTLFFDKDGNITDLTNTLPAGLIWNMGSLHLIDKQNSMLAGKVMGMAGYGTPNNRIIDLIDLYIEDNDMSINNYTDRSIIFYNLIKMISSITEDPFDIAASIQEWTNIKVLEIITPLRTSKNICVSGGVAYNGYMNEQLYSIYDQVHVPPTPGDEGQATGVYMHADYILNGNKHKHPMYGGRAYNVSETIFNGLEYKKMPMSEIYPLIAQCIAEGKIVGWYQDRSETGNRALGNRSILADPRNPEIKNIINRTIKFREDYRPFAPSVMIEHYKEYFDTPAPSPYMARIMPVISDKIPGVTHVDGTARIQTVDYKDNPKYHNLLSSFYSITGIPMLVNTSFNCQEPIVETPEQAVYTFKRTAIDILVINDYVVFK